MVFAARRIFNAGPGPLWGVVVDYAMDEGAEARRKARSSYAVRVYREGDAERMEDDDALDWDRIPVDDRAAFVWQLSQEVYALAHLDAPAQPGLSRSVVRVVRR
jgi:hypothetical protein